jgi:glyceraldehyde 3-phosphate dehydrogenase
MPRSPTACSNCTRPTTAEEVNALFESRVGKGPAEGILGYETGRWSAPTTARYPRSIVIDALSTMVVNGTLLKVYAWYDNEWATPAAWSISPAT